MGNVLKSCRNVTVQGLSGGSMRETFIWRSRRMLWLAIICFGLLFSSTSQVHAVTYEVVTNLDSFDAVACAALGPTEFCTLRDALGSPLLVPGDVITFDIVGFPLATIALESDLPAITVSNITIDANNEIILSRLSGATSGLIVEADNATIVGFTAIEGFTNGIYVDDAANVTIGGGGLDRNNIIGNTNGILIEGDNADGAQIQNNNVGLDTSGNEVSNTNGIVIQNGADGAQIGVAGRNIISGNRAYGIDINAADNHVIRDNYIGFDSVGFSTRPNDRDGIRIRNASGHTIDDNLISANGRNGVQLSNITNTSITNNDIGVSPFGITPGGNGTDGLRIIGLTSDNITIMGNTITTNRGLGVRVVQGTRVRISNNSIVGNTGGLGIDLGSTSVQSNDLRDNDSGANNLQNYPVLTAAFGDGIGATLLEGTFNSTPNSVFTLEIYYNSACDPSDFGEGETFETTIGVATDANGNATFSGSIGSYAGGFITALAIDANGNTSEFSRCIEITADPPIANFRAIPPSGLAPLDVQFENLSEGIITTYDWDFECDLTIDDNTENPMFTYTLPGVYDVCLTVTGPGGSDSITRRVIVYDVLPATETPENVIIFPPAPTATPTDITPTSTPTILAIPSLTATLLPTLTDMPSQTIAPSQTTVPTQTIVPSMTAAPTQTTVPTITVEPTPEGTPEVEIEKEADDDTDFSITISNPSEATIDDVMVIEDLRDEVVFIAVAPDSPTCIEDEGVIICTFDSLPPNSSTGIDITVDSNGANPDSGTTTVLANGQVIEILDEPYILKLGQPPIAGPGDIVTYTIRVINPTDRVINRIRVEDVLPDAVEIIEAEASSGMLITSGRFLAFNQVTLEPGGRITITIVTRVREDGQFNEIINEACLISFANASERCARMQFLRASQLPDTGEVSVINDRLHIAWRIGILAVGVGLLTLLYGAFRRFVAD